MKLLLNERQLIIGISSEIEYGVWGNIGDLFSWKIGNMEYAMDDHYTVVDIGDQEIPTYVRALSYYYIDGEFKLADECPNEYRDKITMYEEELLNTQLALIEQYEANIVLEEELVTARNEITDLQLAICELYEALL